MTAQPHARAERERQGVAPAGTGAREYLVRRESHPLKRLLMILGPGLISGAADDDPSGIGTYAVAGASLGFSTLWTMLVMLPMMAATQYISAKISMQTGMGLVAVLKRHYPRRLLYVAVFALVGANTINAGADIGAVAAAINLLVPVPIAALIVPIGVLILVVQIWCSYRLIANIFKWLTLALLAYVANAFLARPHLAEVLRATLVPTLRFDGHFMAVLVGILGTTISPYLWFWQADQEVEERIAAGQKRLWQRRGTSERELRYAAWDVNIGMLFSQVIGYFVILSTAATLFHAGKTDVKSAADAAEALRPLAGNAARVLFALGLIGLGFLAIPVLSGSAAYAMAEAFGWRAGLDQKPRRAKEFYGIIAASTLVGILINYLGINPIDALFFTAVIFGFLTPPLLALLMLAAQDRKVMGEHVNSPLLNILGWATTVATAAAAAGLVGTWGK